MSVLKEDIKDWQQMTMEIQNLDHKNYVTFLVTCKHVINDCATREKENVGKNVKRGRTLESRDSLIRLCDK